MSMIEKSFKIVLQSLKVLKNKMVKFIPSKEVLGELDEACKQIVAETREHQIIRPCLYIRAVISKVLNSQRTTNMAESKTMQHLTKPVVTVPGQDAIVPELKVIIPNDRLVTNVLNSRQSKVKVPKYSNESIYQIIIQLIYQYVMLIGKLLTLLKSDLFCGIIEKKGITWVEC